MKTGHDAVNPGRARVLPLKRRSAVTAPCASTEGKSLSLPRVSRSFSVPAGTLKVSQPRHMGDGASSRADESRRRATLSETPILAKRVFNMSYKTTDL